MTEKEFFYLVETMRKAQKHYFRLRKSGAEWSICDQAKKESIKIEKLVDQEIDRVNKILTEGPTLF